MNHPSPLRHDSDAKLPAAAYLRYESRADGWSGGRQAAFLSHLADNGLVEDAARSVGMSVGGGYSLRRTARGYAFNLGWEAALIIARRVVSDRLMTAAIKGEEARWVREEGVTTYTRQNSKLSLALLDRVNPATTLAEVMAVATRFDWFLQLIDKGARTEDYWDLFFEDALPHSEMEARARVRASLLLSEESAGFEESEEEDDAPIEYKSMDGPLETHPETNSLVHRSPEPVEPKATGGERRPSVIAQTYGRASTGSALRLIQGRVASILSSANSAPLREAIFSSRKGAEDAEIFDATLLLSESPLGEVPAGPQLTKLSVQRLPQPTGYGTCIIGRRRGRATCGDAVSMPFFRPAGVMLALATGLSVPAALTAAPPAPAAPPPLVCAAIAPLPADLAAIAKAKPGIERETVNTSIKGPLLGGTLGCVETLDASGNKIAVMRSEEFTLQGVKGRIVYNEGSVSIALDPSRLPRRKLSSIGAADFHCSWPNIGTNSARCEVGIDADANMRMIGLAADEGKVAGLEVYPALFKTGNDAMDADKPVRLYNAAGTAMEQRWNKGNMVFIQYLSSMMFEGPQFLSIINGLKRDEFLSVEAYERGKDKPSIRRAEASVVFGNLNTALALAEALRKK